MGMAVSYDRVMEVRKGLAISVSKRFAEDGVVLPSNIKRRVFTTAAVDNIDESGRTELHGTAISLTNHITHENTGIFPAAFRFGPFENATIHLHEDFATVPYVDEHAGEISLSTMLDGSALPTFNIAKCEMWSFGVSYEVLTLLSC